MASSDNSKSISGSHSIPFTKSTTDAWVFGGFSFVRHPCSSLSFSLIFSRTLHHVEAIFAVSVSRLTFIHCHFSFQDMTAFSPPADSWIIRYPKKETQAPKEDMRKPARVPEAEQLEDPCRKYISGGEIPIKSNKSLGTDDHFKSAVCSKNLLKVCEKLMVNKEFVTHTNDSVDDDFGELSLMNEKSRMDFYRQKHGNRRGSRSLPVSPKMERKTFTESAAVAHNPYFTVTKPSQENKSNIGFLTNLFGITAAKPALAKANLAKKYEHDKVDISSVDITGDSAQQTRKLTPKPHEYREMNIFSPTSMWSVSATFCFRHYLWRLFFFFSFLWIKIFIFQYFLFKKTNVRMWKRLVLGDVGGCETHTKIKLLNLENSSETNSCVDTFSDAIFLFDFLCFCFLI